MRSDFVNSDVFKVLTSCMQYENGLALRVSIETGLRIGDVLKLRRRDVDGTKLSFVASKTGKSGTKELPAKLARELDRIARFRDPDKFIFEGRKKGSHRTRQAVYTDLKKACARMGVDGQISPHSARKSYAVKVFHDKGLNAVQKELQHRNVSDTFIYCLSDVFAPKHKKQEDSHSAPPTECPLASDDLRMRLAREIAVFVAEKLREND